MRLHPLSTLFPYTTLFRSALRAVLVDATRTDPLPPGVGADVPVYAAAPVVLQRITGLGVHRGLLACFDRRPPRPAAEVDRKSTRLNSSHLGISYAVFCLKK